MFLISISAVLISSYLILSVIDKKYEFKNNLGFIFLILIAFSQIILSFEILSLFKLITLNNFLITNIIFLIGSIVLWLKNSSHLYIPKIRAEFQQIKKALKQDKILTFIAFCFIIFFICRLFYAVFFPITFGDALQYYLPRCTMWIQNASLSHFITPEARELIMPINSELMYLWLMLFTKNEIGCGIFPFIFYTNAIYVIYNFLGELGFCRRKRLWSIFVFSSFALIFLESVIPGSDLWVGSLIITCFYLFLCGCKTNKKFLIFMSALSYALAIGVKTTAIIAIPASLIILIVITALFGKKQTKQNILYFICFFFLNFLIFSSYNYFLNLIEFHNPISNQSQLLINSFRGGLKGYVFNLISYLFSVFDYSGIPDFLNFELIIHNFQNKIFLLLGLSPDNYASEYFQTVFTYNSQLHVACSVLGITGLLTFYPSIFVSIFAIIKNKTSKRTILLFALVIFYILSILIISRTMLFTKYNMRYLLAFIVPTSLIIVYTYLKSNKNIYKIILCIFMFIMLAFHSHTKPFTYIVQYIQYKSSPVQDNYKNFLLSDSDELQIYKYFMNKNNKTIGLLIYNNRDFAIYYIYKLRLLGHNLEVILPEIISEYDLTKYDYIIVMKDFLDSNIIKNFQNHKVDMSKSVCIYADYQGKIINVGENKIPILVSCSIPYNYIINNEFLNIENLDIKNYLLLKNTKEK